MIIGIDHGYYAIKTRHCSFPAGHESNHIDKPSSRHNVMDIDDQ